MVYRLLIVPEGIEIEVAVVSTVILLNLLIVPEGIEIVKIFSNNVV